VAAVYRELLDGRLGAGAAARRLADLAPFAPPANGFWHGAEGARLVAAARDAE
jgi:hypothetical protein